MSASDARQALELAKSGLVSETIESKTYWFLDGSVQFAADKDQVFLMPAYDEFTISYADRRASIPDDAHTKSISRNGIFHPVILVDGIVRGIWKRQITKDEVILKTELFMQPARTMTDHIGQAALKYGQFLGKKVVL